MTSQISYTNDLMTDPRSAAGSLPPPVFEVRLWLQAPEFAGESLAWTLPLGARRGWKRPFGVLLGQRGWFDRFPSRIDASTVEVGGC